MSQRFEGKTAIVTGSGGGIGRAAAIGLAKEGANVVLVDLKSDGNAETLEMIESHGGNAMVSAIDVSKEEQVKEMTARAVSTYGSLDIGVNNAGIFQHVAALHEQTDADFSKVIDVNLRGVWLCMKYQLQEMVRAGKGAIVNTTSFSAVAGVPGVGFYVASKHGVLGLTRSAAVDYAPLGIRINAVGPGAVNTPMVDAQIDQNPEFAEQIRAAQKELMPAKRVAEPEELASAILFLASDESSYVMGHNLMVDGGMSID